MTGRAIIFLVAGIIIISSIIFYRIEAASTDIVSNFGNYYLNQAARNIAQSGVNLGLRKIANSPTWRTGFPLMDMIGGKVTVSAFDTTFAGVSVVAIRSTGIMAPNTKQEARATSTAFVVKRLSPPPLPGVIMTNGPTASGGGIIIDGRDHTTSGTVIPGQGVYGIWSSSTFSQGGSSSVGGTLNGVDIDPTNKKNQSSKVIQQNWPSNQYPTTPDSVFGGASYGYPEGTLKSIAQSGVSGSQYVTDPTTLTLPLTGVTYVELPSGGVWNPWQMAGSGILIVHNSAHNAVLSNTSGGDFVGIVIGDDIVHINNIIIGAVVALTSSPSSGNEIGNGNGQVLYSSAAIAQAANFSSAASTGNVVAWWE